MLLASGMQLKSRCERKPHLAVPVLSMLHISAKTDTDDGYDGYDGYDG